MNLDSLNQSDPSVYQMDNQSPPAKIKNPELYHAAREFEGIFTAAILKQGLRSITESMGSDDDVSKSNNTYMEIAYEQLAYAIGRQGILGIADSIYETTNGIK